jgi:hypothetical protein
LPNKNDFDENVQGSSCPYDYEEFEDIHDDEYRLLERNVYDLDEFEKCQMIKYKFDKMINMNYEIYNTLNIEGKENLNLLFSGYYRKLHIVQNIVNELNENKPSIKEIVYDINENEQKNYDVYVDTNVICTDINNNIKKLLNCNNMLKIQYSTNDIKNNMNEWLNIIDKAKKIYNFRENQRKDGKNQFTYVNACIKHIIKNYIGCDISRARTQVNGKRYYVYYVNTNNIPLNFINELLKGIDKINKDE